MIVRDLTLENHTGGDCAKISNHGTIGVLYAECISKEKIHNDGSIGKLI